MTIGTWPTVKKVPINQIKSMKGDRLMSFFRSETPQFMQIGLLPFKVDNVDYAIDINGQVNNQQVLSSILNGKDIDTSKSFDPVTGQVLIYDV